MTTTSLCPVTSLPDTADAEPKAGTTEGSACPVAPGPGRFIPYVTLLKSEYLLPTEDVVLRPDGLGVKYRDEVPEDRDRRGALWVRTAAAESERAIPMFKRVHPRRAGAAMLDMRCQGCNGEPDRNRQGTLFFVKPDPSRRTLRNWPDVEYTHHPPVCLPCTHQAMLACSFVQTAPAVRARQARSWGVDCIAYRPGPDGTLQFDRDTERCAYDDLKLLPWTVAIQPVARLSRCTIVDIRAELAAAGLPLPDPAPDAPSVDRRYTIRHRWSKGVL